MKSLNQVFQFMHDIDFQYVVLRNWENLPDSVEYGDHSDLDLLVYDLDHFKEIFTELHAEFPYPRVRFKLPIGKEYIFMDVRFLGDGYYPGEFEKAILDTREWNEKGFYTPNPIHHRIALAYHAVHHKGANTYQKYLGDVSVKQLLESLKKSEIGWSEPTDKSVGRFNPYWKGATSVVSMDKERVIKQQTGYRKYDLMENEHRILTKIQSVHFPRVLSFENKSLEIENCGEMLTVNNLPVNWKTQLVQILMELKLNKIIHRDIRPNNLMVKNGIIKLIDFGWARFDDDEETDYPSCLGYPYKPSYGFDDNYSMGMVIRKLEVEQEDKLEEILK